MDDDSLSNIDDSLSQLSPNDSVDSQSQRKTPIKRSFVWKHFIELTETTNNIRTKWALCSYCTKKYCMSQGTKGSTSNLVNHLRKMHNDKVQNSPKYFESTSTNNGFVFKQQNFREALLKWIVVCDLPFTTPEHQMFIAVVQTLNPHAIIVSDDSVKRDLMNEFNKYIYRYQEMFVTINSCVSFSSDEWTSKNMLGFMGCRAHWIDKNWKLEHALIGFNFIDQGHSGRQLGKMFLSTITSVGLNLRKLMGITTDNATSNDKLMEFIEEEGDKLGLNIMSQHNRIRCIAHILNLVVQDILLALKLLPSENNEDWTEDEPTIDEFDELDENLDLENLQPNYEDDNNEEEVENQEPESDGSFFHVILKLRGIVKKIRSSPKMSQEFKKFCRFHNLQNLRPIIDVKTRWNSTYKMIERAKKLKLPLLSFCSTVTGMSKFKVNENEWGQIDKLMSLLCKFNEATLLMSQDCKPHISNYIPIYNWLLNSLQNLESDEILSSCVSAGISKLLKYKPTIEKFVIPFVATFLNPSLKLEYFKSHNYDGGEIRKIKSTIFSIFKDKYEEASDELSVASNLNNDDFTAHLNKRSKLEKNLSEIQRYVNSGLASSDVDILSWWKVHESEYKRLSLMAKDYLAVQPTSVSNERDFSSAVDLITPNRCSLNPETVSACMCLKMLWKP